MKTKTICPNCGYFERESQDGIPSVIMLEDYKVLIPPSKDEICVSKLEYRILGMLAHAEGNSVSRDKLVSLETSRALDQSISRLNRKLIGTGIMIIGVHGRGYALIKDRENGNDGRTDEIRDDEVGHFA